MARTVSLVTQNLYTYDGATVVLGGLERYTRDLAFLCQRLGYEPTVFQFGLAPWEREYEGITVRGYPWKGDAVNCVEQVMKADIEASDHVIYMWAGLQRNYHPSSLTISHGIWFDQPEADKEWGINALEGFIRPALAQTCAVVTVDLSFLEYCRCILPGAGIHKMCYIPNYVDTDLFKPCRREEDGMLEILYPRRIDAARGIYLMQEIVPELLLKYPQVRFNFAIDSNWPHLVAQWKTWQAGQGAGNRIRYRHYSMDEMPQAYQEADIVVIPSLCSEGTSFAALEGMACGKALVCSNVGGLANLILPDFNGKIVNPSTEGIRSALEEYIHSEEDRRRHGENARSLVEQAFTKKRWERQWTELMLKVFGNP